MEQQLTLNEKWLKEPGSLVRRAGYFISGAKSKSLGLQRVCVREGAQERACALRPDADPDSSSSTSWGTLGKFPDPFEVQSSHLYDGKSGAQPSGQSGGNDTVIESCRHTTSAHLNAGIIQWLFSPWSLWVSWKSTWFEGWCCRLSPEHCPPSAICVNWAKSMNSFWGQHPPLWNGCDTRSTTRRIP